MAVLELPLTHTADVTVYFDRCLMAWRCVFTSAFSPIPIRFPTTALAFLPCPLSPCPPWVGFIRSRCSGPPASATVYGPRGLMPRAPRGADISVAVHTPVLWIPSLLPCSLLTFTRIFFRWPCESSPPPQLRPPIFAANAMER
eukprot:EG_transcript_27223